MPYKEINALATQNKPMSHVAIKSLLTNLLMGNFCSKSWRGPSGSPKVVVRPSFEGEGIEIMLSSSVMLLNVCLQEAHHADVYTAAHNVALCKNCFALEIWQRGHMKSWNRMIWLKLVLRFSRVEFNAWLRLSRKSSFFCWKLSIDSANNAISIFRVNVITGRFLKALYKEGFRWKVGVGIHPEVGNCNVCQNTE